MRNKDWHFKVAWPRFELPTSGVTGRCLIHYTTSASQSDIHTYIHTYIHTCLLLLISMLWHRQAIFESKGDKLFSSAESRIHTYIHTCLLLLISMLWQRQAIFESKGDKLSSSAEGRIRTQGLRYLFTSRLNACWQTDWAIEDQAKNLNSTARPYDQQAFSPLDLTTNWLSHLALAMYRRTDRRTDIQTDRQTEASTIPLSP